MQFAVVTFLVSFTGDIAPGARFNMANARLICGNSLGYGTWHGTEAVNLDINFITFFDRLGSSLQ